MTRSSHSPERLPLLAGAVFLAVTFCHFVALPILITWDGHDYVDLAGVLGSARFPRDWRPIRAPLFPLGLKLSFAVFGRGPLAAELVPLAMAVLGCLLLASSVRRVAGSRAAAAVLAVLALYPTLIVYEHAVLTETGTFCFLALALRLSLWRPATSSAAWKKAASLGLALGAGYCWRQTILMLAPWFALLHLLPVRPLFKVGRRGWIAGLQALLVAALPWGIAHLWARQLDPQQLARLNAIVLRSFVIRQAVIPPTDARVAQVRDKYQAAIAAAERQGFLSGIPWPQVGPIADQVAPPAPEEGALRWLATVVREYPGRYAAAVGRSLVFCVGFDAAENEIRATRDLVLSPTARTAQIAEGREPIAARHRREFAQSTEPGLVRRGLGWLGPIFDWIVIVCNLVTALLLVVSLVRRDLGLLALSGTPVLFAVGHAVALLSINRLMVPIYPITLACGLVALFRLGRRLRAARVSGRASASGGEPSGTPPPQPAAPPSAARA
ncbi:MAG TPA: glycosyltransferase family 39 protein [Thermoanaerobaculia bacterium]|jgi:4-amino-4-deoxy-L-arabinose transferase-like glycosyltransferase|nr:glycosyltransferase family 39 protein [Thermoanaerobaculia bacterium]